MGRARGSQRALTAESALEGGGRGWGGGGVWVPDTQTYMACGAHSGATVGSRAGAGRDGLMRGHSGGQDLFEVRVALDDVPGTNQPQEQPAPWRFTQPQQATTAGNHNSSCKGDSPHATHLTM